jgi:Sulfotransferase domain
MSAKGVPRGPDFLVIGAQRAGTTWLHQALSQHPALWLTPVKELHYFDKLHRTRTWLDPYERRRVRPKKLDLWHLRYLLGQRSDKWYARLFHAAQMEGRLAGESTPSYAVLDDEGLRHIRSINSKVKLIFVMRDPVDRAWSAATNAYRKGRITGLSVHETVDWAHSRNVTQRSMYLDTIRRVESIFSPEQLHCGFFDDLRDRPDQFVAEVLSFLGAESDRTWKLAPQGAMNATGGSKPMPGEFARTMAAFHLPGVRELSQHFEGPPQRWQARYDALINGSAQKG